MSTPRKKKISYGNVEISKDAFSPKNVKLRVTMMVDEEVINAFRAAAEKLGTGYQTLMNEKLRDAMTALAGEKTVEERLSLLEQALKKKTG